MPDAPSLSSSLFSTALALGFVLALAWVLLRLLKRVQQGRASNPRQPTDIPRVLRSVPLGPQQRLVTAHYRGREYLLGVTNGAISVIDSMNLVDSEAESFSAVQGGHR